MDEGDLRTENPGMAELSSTGAPLLLNSHTQSSQGNASVATWCTHNTHGTTQSALTPCNLCSCTNRPHMNIHSRFVHGCLWDWAGKGCHTANKQRPPGYLCWPNSQHLRVLLSCTNSLCSAGCWRCWHSTGHSSPRQDPRAPTSPCCTPAIPGR